MISKFNSFLTRRTWTPRTALIDGDILVYRLGFASEKNGEPDPVEMALHSVKVYIQSIMDGARATEKKVYLTGDRNFRDEIATILPYKGNRSNSSKPYHYDAIREYLIQYHDAIVSEGNEADDLLSIETYQNYQRHNGDQNKSDVVLCSLDKDLNMVPGWHYNWNREELYWVTEDEGIKTFYLQLLTGDRTDNIQGIPRIGPKKAEKLLEGLTEPYEMYVACLKAYTKYYEEIAYEALLENARLLWMQREPDELWEPDEGWPREVSIEEEE